MQAGTAGLKASKQIILTLTPTPLTVQVERLEEVRDQERESPIFTELPANHIFEVANLVLDNATQVSNSLTMLPSVFYSYLAGH